MGAGWRAAGRRPDAAIDHGARAMLRPEYRDMMGVGNPFGAEQPAGEDATTDPL